MATADRIYTDPSVLLKLYLNEPESRAVAAWRMKIRAPLPITPHGRAEIVNGIALAAYRRFIDAATLSAALSALDDDFEQGRYRSMDLLWRATLKRAGELSRAHTPTLGTRALDVLHVASALELGLPAFATFDDRQRKLAQAVGLKMMPIR